MKCNDNAEKRAGSGGTGWMKQKKNGRERRLKAITTSLCTLYYCYYKVHIFCDTMYIQISFSTRICFSLLHCHTEFAAARWAHLMLPSSPQHLPIGPARLPNAAALPVLAHLWVIIETVCWCCSYVIADWLRLARDRLERTRLCCPSAVAAMSMWFFFFFFFFFRVASAAPSSCCSKQAASVN